MVHFIIPPFINDDNAFVIKTYHDLAKDIPNKYKLIRYRNKHNQGLYRSIILDNTNKIICFAPPKSVEIDETFWQSDCYAEEFIDGTMINLFWDETISDWNIATKNCIGGKNHFYNKNKTFRYLFLDCLSNQFDFDRLPKIGLKGYPLCYSFVIQHKANRIVDKIINNVVYLVEVYELKQLDDGTTYIFSLDLNGFYVDPSSESKHDVLIEWSELFKELSINRPKLYCKDCNFENYHDLVDCYASAKTPYMIMGIIFKNKKGLRAKVRNPNYEKVRKLKGNQANLLYHYLELRKNNSVKNYLNYYEEHINEFHEYKTSIDQFIMHLYNHYVSCYILKENPLKQFEFAYRSHMYNLHELYRSSRKKTTINVVKRYFLDLHPAQQTFSLNKIKIKK